MGQKRNTPGKDTIPQAGKNLLLKENDNESPEKNDNCNRRSPVQIIIQITMFGGGGLLAFGALLDALSNALSIITFRITVIGTVVAVLLAVSVLSFRIFGKSALADTGQRKMIISLLTWSNREWFAMMGIVLLLWAPLWFPIILGPEKGIQPVSSTEHQGKLVGLDVWCANDYTKIEDNFDSTGDNTIRYSARKRGDVTVIEPQTPYLKKLADGGPIEALYKEGAYFNLRFPRLDFKLVNNKKETLIATKVVLMIEQSRLDPFPLLVVDSDPTNLFHFRLVNEGWGNLEEGQVKFNITKNGVNPDFTAPFNYSREPIRFDRSLNINVTDELQSLGMDTNTIIGLNKIAQCKWDDLPADAFEQIHKASSCYACKWR